MKELIQCVCINEEELMVLVKELIQSVCINEEELMVLVIGEGIDSVRMY